MATKKASTKSVNAIIGLFHGTSKQGVETFGFELQFSQRVDASVIEALKSAVPMRYYGMKRAYTIHASEANAKALTAALKEQGLAMTLKDGTTAEDFKAFKQEAFAYYAKKAASKTDKPKASKKSGATVKVEEQESELLALLKGINAKLDSIDARVTALEAKRTRKSAKAEPIAK